MKKINLPHLRLTIDEKAAMNYTMQGSDPPRRTGCNEDAMKFMSW